MEKARAPRGFRNKPLLVKNLMKQRDGKLKARRAKKARAGETRDKKQDRIQGGEDADEEVPKKSKNKI